MARLKRTVIAGSIVVLVQETRGMAKVKGMDCPWAEQEV